MTVGNATAHLYRFFDATAQVEYLYRCIQETIRKDLREEIGFLAVFDGAVRRVMHIVDMPDRRASLLVRLILQNKGKLSNSKRTLFAEVSDDELHNIERAVWQTWEEEHAKAGAADEGKALRCACTQRPVILVAPCRSCGFLGPRTRIVLLDGAPSGQSPETIADVRFHRL